MAARILLENATNNSLGVNCLCERCLIRTKQACLILAGICLTPANTACAWLFKTVGALIDAGWHKKMGTIDDPVVYATQAVNEVGQKTLDQKKKVAVVAYDFNLWFCFLNAC